MIGRDQHYRWVFVAALQESSSNGPTPPLPRRLAGALGARAERRLQLKEIPFADLRPIATTTMRTIQPSRGSQDSIAAVDAVLFVTPEYNRSIPGALKNAIDWASRPYGKNSFTRKPSAVIVTSPGKIGTAVGQQHLRSILAFCNSPQMNPIEAYIQFTPGLINEDGDVTDDSTAEFLRGYMRNSLRYWPCLHRLLGTLERRVP